MEFDEAENRRRAVRVPRRLDRLVSSGRLTAEEADRLRVGADGEVDEEVLVGIRARHAAAKLDAGVAAGEIDREEADAIRVRLLSGEHSAELRARLNRLGGAGRVQSDSTVSGNAPQRRRSS